MGVVRRSVRKCTRDWWQVDLALLRGGPHWNTAARGVIARASAAAGMAAGGGGEGAAAAAHAGGIRLDAASVDAGRRELEASTPLFVAGAASRDVK